MTLLVAARFPLGLVGTSSHPEQTGVIVLADSRWSYTTPGIPPFDAGIKLLAVAPNAVAAYAGDVECGELALARLTERLKRSRKKDRHQGLQVTQEILRRTYKEIGERRAVGLLYALVGAVVKRRSYLLCFDYDREFSAQSQSGVVAVGDDTTNIGYQTGLKHVIADTIRSAKEIPLDPRRWGVLLAIPFHDDVIETKGDPTVGGPIQALVVTINGIHRPHYSLTTDPTDQGSWKDVTAKEPDLTSYHWKYRLPLRALVPHTTGCHQIIG
ncbi:MAG: hypothetical protein FJ318_04790 [SAR202 cluster bacterium]|nr:hypothetical protein [SAR202 cluster bacterium]